MTPRPSTPDPPSDPKLSRPLGADLRQGLGRQADWLKALFGLTVLWGALCLVDWAQSIHYGDRIEFGPIAPSRGVEGGDREARELVARATQTVRRVSFRETTAAAALRALLNDRGFTVAIAELERLTPNQPRPIALGELPLHEAVHRILNDPRIGFVLGPASARFFRQRLSEIDPPDGPPARFRWEAEPPLESGLSVVFPSERSDVRLFLAMAPDSPGGESARMELRVVVADGAGELLDGALRLTNDREGRLESAAARAKVSVMVRPIGSAGAEAPPNDAYRIEVYFERVSAAGEAPTRPPASP
jgi:hypothetical protein